MVGKNPKFKSSKKLQEAIDGYFESCAGEILKDENGEPVLNKSGQPAVINGNPPTLSGLALALGFSSKNALLSYQAGKKCEGSILRAISKIEEYTERRLFDKEGLNGAKFILVNNFKGWKDKPAGDGNSEKLDEVLNAIGGAMYES